MHLDRARYCDRFAFVLKRMQSSIWSLSRGVILDQMSLLLSFFKFCNCFGRHRGDNWLWAWRACHINGLDTAMDRNRCVVVWVADLKLYLDVLVQWRLVLWVLMLAGNRLVLLSQGLTFCWTTALRHIVRKLTQVTLRESRYHLFSLGSAHLIWLVRYFATRLALTTSFAYFFVDRLVVYQNLLLCIGYLRD